MKHSYFVCAAVNTQQAPDNIISTNVTIEHPENLQEGDVAKLLIKAIPSCQAIINFWEYGFYHSTKEYRDARTFVYLLQAELFGIIEDTKDPQLKARLQDLYDSMQDPRLIRSHKGRINVEEE